MSDKPDDFVPDYDPLIWGHKDNRPRKALVDRIAELEAELERRERLTVNMDLEHRATIERLRAALWIEYRESFNDLGPTRQARWKSDEAYANALMADFDREALKGDKNESNTD